MATALVVTCVPDAKLAPSGTTSATGGYAGNPGSEGGGGASPGNGGGGSGTGGEAGGSSVEVVALSAGSNYTCARLANGEVRCWGDNGLGQLGDGFYEDRFVPVKAKGIDDAQQIMTGNGHSCARRANDTLSCWGFNSSGQVSGTATTTSFAAPYLVDLVNVKLLAKGLGTHTCVLLFSGEVHCWGSNAVGQLGDGTQDTGMGITTVTGLNGIVIGLATSWVNSCALMQDKTVYCWGDDSHGQLGDGEDSNPDDYSEVPVQVVGLDDVTKIATGFFHGCAVRESGAVACWGDNTYGELGTGQSGEDELIPVLAGGLDDPQALALGLSYSCALKKDGTVWCWGGNGYGQLGNNNEGESSPEPVAVVGLSNATAITAGFTHACALLESGQVRCWGNNVAGQLGDGKPGTNSPVPAAPVPF